MKYKCSCGTFEVDSPAEFYTHIAESNLNNGHNPHVRVTEVAAPESKAEKKAVKQIQTEQPTKPKEKHSLGVGKKSGPSFISRKWMGIGGGIVSILLGIAAGNAWIHLKQGNNFLGIFVMLLIGGGIYGVIWGIRQGIERGSSVVVVRPEGDAVPSDKAVVPAETQALELAAKGRGVKNVAAAVVGNVNSLNVYAREGVGDENEIVPVITRFEWTDKPLGQPWKLTNDGHYYYFHVIDIKTGNFRAGTLKDAKYVDPSIFARFLENPAQKRYIEYMRESLAKWIGPGILALMDGIGLFVLFVMANSAAQGGG